MNKLVVTHDGGFHADEVFAFATLKLIYGDHLRIQRTRDEGIINGADIVLDVGGIYDEEKNRFDHHQIGGAGIRKNGIPYSSFGLVWKKYGEEVCKSKVIASLIEKEIVYPIDAWDCGVDLCKENIEGASPFTASLLLGLFNPTYKEEITTDECFLNAVVLAKQILERELEHKRADIEAKEEIEKIYASTDDKRLLILENYMPWERNITNFKDLLYVIHPRNGKWRIYSVLKNMGSFEQKKPLPKDWAGLRGKEFADITGVPDAIFCHNKLFTAGAVSREAIEKLAAIALEY